MEIGDKIKGFKFDSSYMCGYANNMDNYIGMEGEVRSYNEYTNSYNVLFEDGVSWLYPKELCKKINKKNKID